jgi:predicted nucleic acid-binding protein
LQNKQGFGDRNIKAAGRVLGTPDTVIAATAYLHDYSLVTNNAKDYPMPELKLYKYTQEKAA